MKLKNKSERQNVFATGTALGEWCLNDGTDIEIEVGSSWGQVLLQLAEHNPHVRYAGIEIQKERHLSAVQRAKRSRLHNVTFVHGDAAEVLEEEILNGRISTFHIYFPSPVYNDRHGQQRELINKKFASSLYVALKSGGRVRLLTDLSEYYDRILEAFGSCRFWSFKCNPLGLDLPNGFIAGSPLEYKYRPVSRIYSLNLVK